MKREQTEMKEIHVLSLIKEVKRRPGLWSQDQPTDRDERLALWKDIGAALFSDWDKVSKATVYDRVIYMQKKWRSLRDTYKREVRIRTQNPEKKANKCVYRYFKDMMFLGGYEDSVSPEEILARAESKISDDSNSDDNEGTMELETIEESDSESYDPLVNTTVESSSSVVNVKSKRPKPKKRKVQSHSSDYETQALEIPIEMEMPMMETDSDKLFLLSFLPEMKQLPGNIKMWARAQIANTMQEAVNCHYNNTTPSGMTVVKRQRQNSSE